MASGLPPNPWKDTETVRELYEFECTECGTTNERVHEFEPAPSSVVHCNECGEMTTQQNRGRK